MSNIESISARLRRWADEGESYCMFPAINAARETGCTSGATPKGEAELFRHVSDEIDREMNELRNKFRVTHPMQAVGDIATGKEVYPLLREAIDRYYLPRPLFEDGEPVYIGAEIEDRKRGKLEVSRICYTDAGFYFNNSRDGSKRKKTKGITYAYGERVGRPKQQVLDADGVPIEVGDTVYILPGEHCDKLPIKGFAAGDKCVVINILNLNYGTKRGSILARSEKGVIGYPAPEQVTHREQDSLKKLRDEMREFGEVGADCTSSILLEYADRLTALIELDGRDA